MGELARCPHCGASAREEGAAFCVECGGRMHPTRPGPNTAPLAFRVDEAQAPPAGPSRQTTQPQLPPRPRRATAPNYPSAPPLLRPVKPEVPRVSAPTRGSNPPPPPVLAPPPAPVLAPSPVSPDSLPATGTSTRSAPRAERVTEPGGPGSRTLDEIDKSFDTLVSTPPSGATELTPAELAEAQRLFREMAANYLSPVRALLLELSLGEPSRDWLGLCRPPLTAMRRAAQDMRLTELAQALDALAQVMEQTERSAPAVLDVRSRENLKNAYQPLIALFPEAFAVDDERDRREPIIVQSLLRQVPDVRKVALDRLYAAGLVTLDMFYKARPTDIAEAAGIPRELAERIVARFQRYRRELAAIAPAAKNERELASVETLTRKLEQQTVSFEAAQRSFAHPEEARRIRQERAATLVELQLVLARLGEVALIEKLERLAFRSKTDELRRFLARPRNASS